MYMVCGYIVEKGCCLHVYGWWGMWSDSEDSPFCLNLQLLQQSRRWRGCQGRVGGWVVWCGVVVCGVMCVVWCGVVWGGVVWCVVCVYLTACTWMGWERRSLCPG